MMKTRLVLLSLTLLLSACALTPEQKAEQAHKQKLYEQNLQVSLASQCDKDTAELMRQQFNQPINWTEADKKAFQLKYIDKVSEPMFQACYKMAWQNYISQQRLRQMRDWYDDDWLWGRRGFYRHPFFW